MSFCYGEMGTTIQATQMNENECVCERAREDREFLLVVGWLVIQPVRLFPRDVYIGTANSDQLRRQPATISVCIVVERKQQHILCTSM
jgi:hypothetical protein